MSTVPLKTPLVVGVAGGSCSGKTTFVRRVLERLGPGKCAVLYQDSYYVDQSAKFREDGGDVNFDHPSALDFDLMAEHILTLASGQGIDVPIYDFVTHKRLPRTEHLEVRPLILVDGTLILSQPQVCACLDWKVFLDASEEVRFERRKRRDVVERCRALDGVVKQFLNHVKPMHDQFVEPSKKWAQHVLLTEQDRTACFDQIVSAVQL